MKNKERSWASLNLWIALLAYLILATAAQAQAGELVGIVVVADADDQYMVVQDRFKGMRVRFSITDETVIVKNEERQKIADLAPGTLVIIKYETSGETYIARTISIQAGSE